MHDLHDRGIVDLMSDLGHLLEDPSACKSCIPKQSTCIGPLPSSSLVQRRRPKEKKIRRTADAEDTRRRTRGLDFSCPERRQR
jgi:hypothetical protein